MQNTPLTVFLVDDEKLIRSGMKKLLPWETIGFRIIGEAEKRAGGIASYPGADP